MRFIILILFAILLWYSVIFRCALFNLFKTIKNGCIDFYYYIKHRGWNNAPLGNLICFTGLFGKGKTLSAVHYVRSIYKRYNNKLVYDFSRKKMVRQQIFILSNVHLSDVPFTLFTSTKQMIEYPQKFKELDLINDTLTVTYIIGDEFSVQFNSREFRGNFADPLLLNTLLTCRHWNIGAIVITSQRFHVIDALLRTVTQTVVDCDKIWRFQRVNYYSAWELDNSTNVALVKPYKRSCWFVLNSDYNAYDTKACVDNLIKSSQNGDMMSEEEILNNVFLNNNADTVVHYSRKASKRKKYKKVGIL